MQQDTQNNRPDSKWKHRLEEDGAFAADEIMNSQGAWDTLYKRLHKPGRKKAVWYWMAAAGVMAVVISAMVLQRPVQQEGTVTVKQPTRSTKTGNAIKLKQQTGMATAPVKKDIAIPLNTIQSGVKKELADLDDTALTAPFKNDPPAQPETISIPLAVKEATGETIVTIQPKPQLKVVHVNELGGDSPNNMHSPGADYSVIQVGINNKTIPTPGKIGIQITTAKYPLQTN